MTTTLTLGRLAPVDVRSVWAIEDRDFTPWLARPENIGLLAETLQLGELEIEATERDVGRFSADIVARDQNGSIVLIENQLEPTNHKHLGQVLTYLAGLEGDASVIWIATEFLEEHRAAIDWLNANTNEHFDFFGVEIEVVKIGSSEPAPRFNIVAKPNDWSRDVRSTARQVGEAPLNDRHRVLLAYWASFAAFLERKKSSFHITRPNKHMWYSFRGFGRGGFSINASASVEYHRIGVEVYISRDSDKSAIRALEAQRAQIETEFGEPLEWQELPGRQASRVVIYRKDTDPADEATWQEQHEWMLSKMKRFQATFGPRVAALRLEQPEGDKSDNEREE